MSCIKRNLSEQVGLPTLSDSLSAAGNSQRLRILYLLHVHREMCVCDLAEILELTVSAVSQHLRKLKDKRIVKSRRQGQTIFYSLMQNVFTSILQKMFTLDETRQQHALLFDERN